MWELIVYFALVVLLVGGMLAVSALLGQRHCEQATGAPYDSGIVSEGSGRESPGIRSPRHQAHHHQRHDKRFPGAGASSSMWSLIVILVVTTAIGLFYYLFSLRFMIEGMHRTPISLLLLPASRSWPSLPLSCFGLEFFLCPCYR